MNLVTASVEMAAIAYDAITRIPIVGRLFSHSSQLQTLQNAARKPELLELSRAPSSSSFIYGF